MKRVLFCVLLFVIVSLILMPNMGRCQVEAGKRVLSVLALSESGSVIAEGYVFLSDDLQWFNTLTGDPLSLGHVFPVSLKSIEEQKQLTCGPDVDSEGIAELACANVVVKHPNATQWCPYPIFPHDKIFWGTTQDGYDVYLRLPDSAEPVSVQLGSGNDVIDMLRVDNVEVARVMVAGEPPEMDFTEVLLELQIARQECLNLIAATDLQNQSTEMMNSAALLQCMLEAYFDRNGVYPYQLCQLYTGNRAIVGGFLSNPFKIGESLCLSPKGYDGAIEYFPEPKPMEDDEDSINVLGYWLGN